MILRRHPRPLLSSAICAVVSSILLGGCGGANSTVSGPNAIGQPASHVVQNVGPNTGNTWTTGTGMPTSRYAAAAAVIGSKIYVLGGRNHTGVLGKNEIYDTTTGTWSLGAVMPTRRAALAAAVVNGIVYAIGGSVTTGGSQTTVEAYDPVHNKWSTKASLPTAVDSMGATVDKGLIYIVGGYSSISAMRLNGVETYNPATNVWSTAKHLFVAKSSPFVGTIGTNVIAGGGYGASGPTKDTEAYDPSTNKWTPEKQMATARWAGCGAGIGGLLYAAAGSKSLTIPQINRLDSYNLATNTWTTLAPMPVALNGQASATANGLLYCFGGAKGIPPSSEFNSVLIYHP